MRALTISAVCCAAIAGAALAAEDTSRTYAKQSCSERNAHPESCVIQDGPPRRSAFGNPLPAAVPPKAAPATAVGTGVTVLGGSGGTTPSIGSPQPGR